MGFRSWTFLAGVFVMGVLMPMLLAYQLRLGDFAKSPQTVTLNLGGSIPVAGGRAKMWFSHIDLGPSVEVSCKRERATIELREGEQSEEVCGIRVRPLGIDEVEFNGHTMVRGRFEVTWEEH